MATKHHIIYIPGLGDGTLNLLSQKAAIAAWRLLYGVSTQVVRVKWADKHESFDHKLGRVLHAIDIAAARGDTVSLVAASAGASMAINAYAARTKIVARVVSIVGAHGPASHARPVTLAINPALKESLARQPAAIHGLTATNRGHILGVKPLADAIIRLEDMNIPQINYIKLSTRGHMLTIAAALTISSRRLIAFIKHD